VIPISHYRRRAVEEWHRRKEEEEKIKNILKRHQRKKSEKVKEQRRKASEDNYHKWLIQSAIKLQHNRHFNSRSNTLLKEYLEKQFNDSKMLNSKVTPQRKHRKKVLSSNDYGLTQAKSKINTTSKKAKGRLLMKLKGVHKGCIVRNMKSSKTTEKVFNSTYI